MLNRLFLAWIGHAAAPKLRARRIALSLHGKRKFAPVRAECGRKIRFLFCEGVGFC
jgi:hypothetical protein